MAKKTKPSWIAALRSEKSALVRSREMLIEEQDELSRILKPNAGETLIEAAARRVKAPVLEESRYKETAVAALRTVVDVVKDAALVLDLDARATRLEADLVDTRRRLAIFQDLLGDESNRLEKEVLGRLRNSIAATLEDAERKAGA